MQWNALKRHRAVIKLKKSLMTLGSIKGLFGFYAIKRYSMAKKLKER
jgi:hypothetical protein